jgi:hypothetical protein
MSDYQMGQVKVDKTKIYHRTVNSFHALPHTFPSCTL